MMRYAYTIIIIVHCDVHERKPVLEYEWKNDFVSQMGIFEDINYTMEEIWSDVLIISYCSFWIIHYKIHSEYKNAYDS